MARTTAGQRQRLRNFVSCIDTGAFVGSGVTAGNVSLSGSVLTLTAWVKFKAFQTSSPYISSVVGQEDIAGNNIAQLRMGSGTLANNNRIHFVLKIGGSTPALLSTAALEKGIWYHLAGVYDGVNMVIYINGVSNNSVAQTGSFTAGLKFRIAGSENGRFPSALIDDVRCYKRALTPTEILNLYYGIEPATTNLTVWYKLDEGSGTSATDSSGNGSTSTLTSCTYSTDVVTIPRTGAGARSAAEARTAVS